MIAIAKEGEDKYKNEDRREERDVIEVYAGAGRKQLLRRRRETSMRACGCSIRIRQTLGR